MALLGTIMTPRTDSKIRARILAYKLRNKPADFKDILRERFRSRIKLNRSSLLDRMRRSDKTSASASDGFQDTLCAYLYDELGEFQDSSESLAYPNDDSSSCATDVDAVNDKNSFDIEREIEMMKQIEDELIEEQLNWILEEYRKAEEEQFFEPTPKLVCCPVCQEGFLQIAKGKNLITCARCPIELYTSLSLEQIESAANQTVNEHATYCHSKPHFAVMSEPYFNGLFVICSVCSLFNALS